MYVYLATGLTETSQNLDADEFIELERLSFPDIFNRIRSGEIEDAKTIAGTTLAGSRFGFTL